MLFFDVVVSLFTHSIAGFASLYIGVSKLTSMKKENIYITICILMSFMIIALSVDVITNAKFNYMFLMRPDGTPFSIVYNLVNGNKIIYPFLVASLMCVYLLGYYLVFYTIRKIMMYQKEPQKIKVIRTN